MAKKRGKPEKVTEHKNESGFTFAGIDIPAALKTSGMNVDTLVRHPLVAGLAAMALESLASQIRAKAAAASVAADADAETPKPKAPRKSAAKSVYKKTAAARTPAKCPAKKPKPTS